MSPFLFILITLAAYRLTRLIADDDIPFGPLRARIKTRWATANPTATTYIDGLSCYWCMGFHVSAALVIGVAQVTSVPLPVLVALAVSTTVGMLSEWIDR